MSGGNSASNNWTIVTPEETVAETLRPLAEGTEHHEEASAAGAKKNPVFKEPDSGADQHGGSEASAVVSPVEEHMVFKDKPSELNGHTTTDQHTSSPPALSGIPVPTLLEASCSFVPGSDALNHQEGLPEDPAQSSYDPDSFSDSYTHASPSPDDPPASLLTTETLGGEESTQDEERLVQEGIMHPPQGEELQKGAQSDLSPSVAELEKQTDSSVDSSTVKTDDQGDPEVRRRRRSLLAALEQIGRTEEEEDREEEFQVPQRVDDSVFTLNKCILGAVILLGIGTIFFSESDYGTGELNDSELPGKQEWLNTDVPPPPADSDGTELRDQLAKGIEQISMLQAQVQTQKEELKIAMEQAAEGAVEQLLREKMEKENSRLKTEMASLPVLQKENERMKRELESVSALHKELETLRSTVTELKHSSAGEAARAPLKSTTSPPSGQPEDSRQETTTVKEARKTWNEQKEKKPDWKKEKYDTGEKKEWKQREKSEWKEEEKRERKSGGKIERKQGKHEQGKLDKVKDNGGKQKRQSEETKQWKEKEGKKHMSRGDEGKLWKATDGKKEEREKDKKKDWKEVKDWKKGKHEKMNEGKQEKDWKRGKYGEKDKVREEWKEEKEWKKVNNGFKESGKEKWEKKDWKEKGEKKDSHWRGNDGKDRGKEGRQKGESKRWEESENHSKSHGKERKVKAGKKQWDENERKSGNGEDVKEQRKKEEDWKRGQKKREHNGDGLSFQKHKDEHKISENDHHDKSVWSDHRDPHSHRRPSIKQPEYWVRQRERLRHSPKPPQHCDTLQSCAHTQGLLPVTFSEFHTILQTYLAKVEEVGVDASQRQELAKLTADFFKDGVFLHDQISFDDFAEDVGDILEDMVEAVESEKEVEEEMEEFEREVMKKFSVPVAAKKEERNVGEEKKESRRGFG